MAHKQIKGMAMNTDTICLKVFLDMAVNRCDKHTVVVP